MVFAWSVNVLNGIDFRILTQLCILEYAQHLSAFHILLGSSLILLFLKQTCQNLKKGFFLKFREKTVKWLWLSSSDHANRQ